MEGRGAYTIVDGHEMTLGANDFVLTPNGTWHEHGVRSDGLYKRLDRSGIDGIVLSACGRCSRWHRHRIWSGLCISWSEPPWFTQPERPSTSALRR